MTLSRDLYLAIFSLDSYNRVYDAKISSLGDAANLGNATIQAQTYRGHTRHLRQAQAAVHTQLAWLTAAPLAVTLL